LPTNVDPRLFSWVKLTIFRNLVSQPELLFHGNAFYPVGNTLSFAEPLLVPAVVAGPLHLATGNPVLAYNLTLLLFWGLSGWAMYWVAYRLTGQHGAAAVAGLIFTLAPYRLDHHNEFQMEVAFGLPLALYFLVRFLETQAVRPLLALLAVFWLQAVSVWYYAIILGLGLAVVAVQYAALRWSGWRPRALAAAAAGGGALALALAPVAWPYFVTRRELGYSRGLEDAVARSADLLSYVEARANWLYRVFTVERHPEASLFLGIGGLLLAGLGCLWLRRPRGEVRSGAERALAGAIAAVLALLALTVAAAAIAPSGPPARPWSISGLGAVLLGLVPARHAAEGWRRWRTAAGARPLAPRDWVVVLLGLSGFAFFLSLGPVVALGGRPLGDGLYAWLWPYLLPLQAIRGPTRIGVLYVTAGALLAAFGVVWLRARLPAWPARLAVAGLALVVALEYAWMPLPFGRVPASARPVDRVIGSDPADVAVLEWPANVQASDADAMFRSLSHGKRVVNGFSGFLPDLQRDLSGLLTTPGPSFPVPAAQTALRQIYPLRYLVVRMADPAVSAEWRPVWRGLRDGPPALLRFRGSYGDEDLYEVVPVPERGVTIARWVSYDLLRANPVLRLTLRPLEPLGAREQWVEVRLNDRPVQRLALASETAATVRLPPPFTVAAPNVIGLRWHYRWPPGQRDGRYRIGTTGVLSPGDLHVVSAGQPRGSAGAIQVDGDQLSPDRRGYNLVALDPGGGLLGARAFDTFRDPAAAGALAAWVTGLPPGAIVAGAARDEASGHLSEAAVQALRTLGVAGDLRGRFREAHAFVGVVGAPAGTALEALGDRRLELRVGQPAPAGGFELTGFALVPADGR
jgi:hypothetical protein